MKVHDLLHPWQPTSAASEYLERLAHELDVPVSRYEEAASRYDSVGRWLCRDASTLKDMNPDVYVQGSFRLGTPIRPINDDEHYDIDLVCELSVEKTDLTQRELKELLGHEIKLYAKANGMQDAAEGRRCWTLDYAEGAQFHLDALPALPDGASRQRLLVEAKVDSAWAESAIAITDKDHPNYQAVDAQWPHSNPRGYTRWFRSRMTANFRQIREAMALEAKASVEDIPSYRVKTPLQQAVQILKRHRDFMFLDASEIKPISVILTTLSGLSYQGERTVADAVGGILQRMTSHIKQDSGGFSYIANPTDPLENFADRWRQHPERKAAFDRWIAKAREDFEGLTKQVTQQRIVEVAEQSFGAKPARAAASSGPRTFSRSNFFTKAAALLTASHKQSAPWPSVRSGHVSIDSVTWSGKGFSRPIRLQSDSQPLMKGASLIFKGKTDIPAPFDVHWQVVNTGPEAAAAGKLRGGFDEGSVSRGSISHSESADYSGAHTIECFIVKDRHLAARSGVFVVNVR
ncbi:hypothetical protein J2W27_002699 [Variovorax boronicumulans]|uniref:nucleotidyltransferase n=1 Tax=Variovorax boronicumulans TaxID=436515 RepID=UPI0027815064|nr:nucleotidyltransferase [Variovorax boronicumulans]MDP9910587.1 hypothetical protein [Variovorax boronicumulans]